MKNFVIAALLGLISAAELERNYPHYVRHQSLHQRGKGDSYDMDPDTASMYDDGHVYSKPGQYSAGTVVTFPKTDKIKQDIDKVDTTQPTSPDAPVELGVLAQKRRQGKQHQESHAQTDSESESESSGSDSGSEGESSDSDDGEDAQVQTLAHSLDYPAHMNGFGGYHTYMRDTPDRFETEADDTLMKSMYANYATEGETNGLPNGHFWVTKADAEKAGTEVVGTHLQLKGKELKAYIDSEFPNLWKRYDVNEEGKVEVDRMPSFLRSICGNAEACFGL